MNKQEYEIMYRFEENYWWYVGLHELILFYVNKYSKGSLDKRIFDAGCGTGKMLEMLSNYTYTEGVDFSEEAVFFSKKRGIKNIKVANLNTWKAKENSYDFIISADVICSIGIENDLIIVDNFMKSLKKGGILILNLPALEVLRRNHDKAVFVAKRYSRKQFEADIQKRGYKINFASYRLPFLFFVILIKKFFEKLLKNKKEESDLKNISKPLNAMLLFINRIENFLLKKGFQLPFGSSLFVILEK